MSDAIWLIIGLGNPGSDYELTRHNAGFLVVDELAARHGIRIKRLDSRAFVGNGVIGDERVELVKPQTYMNLSGESVASLVKKRSALDKIIVLVDDLALPFGSIRLRRKGSHGGHNGLRSINDCLKSSDYNRLRIGISPEHRLSNTKKFVLERFSANEQKELKSILKSSADAVEATISDGIDNAMSRFN